jgi:hypothetical protein
MNSAFIADVTYPDGTVVEDNANIAKVWSIQNTGTCTWDDGFSLQPVTGRRKRDLGNQIRKSEFVRTGRNCRDQDRCENTLDRRRMGRVLENAGR